MNNRFVLVMLVCIAAFGGLIFMSKKDAGAPGSSNSSVQATNHTQGKGTTGVTLVEYGDLQCPACGAYYPLLKDVKSKYGDQITFQFRNFPLIQKHPNAMAAHRAAEAADKQGKFWEMHDMLYERQSSWETATSPTSVFEGYAKELGLDVEKFKTDSASSEVNDLIQADIREAQAIKASGTPTFVLDGKRLDPSPEDVEGFYKLIDEAIAAKNKKQ